MKLRQLIEVLLGARLIGDGDVEVRAVRGDSRQIAPGDVFVAGKGLTSDGHGFVDAAVERGAVAVIVEREVEAMTARLKRSANPPAIVVVPSTAKTLGLVVARSFGDPANGMTLIGVTGTNGKTTTTYLVEAILRAAGKAVGVTHGVMEVTSSALARNRIVGLEYAVAAFSNLTQDHLDVHGSMAEYQKAKELLFRSYLAPTGAAVVNGDDPVGEQMGAAARSESVIAVSTEPGSSANVRVVAASS